MSKINFAWPAEFNPAVDRAYIGEDGQPVLVKIAPEVLAIPMIEADVTDPAGPLNVRVQRATELARLGHVIDTQIDVWGWGAENTMALRRLYGKATVPDAFGTIQILVPPAR